MIDLGKEKIEITCSDCNRKIMVTLEQVAKQQTITCSCGTKIELKDKNGSARKSIQDMNKAFSDLEKSLKNLGK